MYDLLRHTPEYIRHGTSSLFAALDVASGAVLGRCFRRHRTEEFLQFLREIDKNVPVGYAVHVVLDNYATHKTPLVRSWLLRHPHFKFHFTPTHASWLNQVERFFGVFTQKQIKRSAHRSVKELETSIKQFIDEHNSDPKPFRWAKSADQILQSVSRAAGKILAVRRAQIRSENNDSGH